MVDLSHRILLNLGDLHFSKTKMFGGVEGDYDDGDGGVGDDVGDDGNNGGVGGDVPSLAVGTILAATLRSTFPPRLGGRMGITRWG